MAFKFAKCHIDFQWNHGCQSLLADVKTYTEERHRCRFRPERHTNRAIYVIARLDWRRSLFRKRSSKSRRCSQFSRSQRSQIWKKGSCEALALLKLARRTSPPPSPPGKWGVDWRGHFCRFEMILLSMRIRHVLFIFFTYNVSVQNHFWLHLNIETGFSARQIFCKKHQQWSSISAHRKENKGIPAHCGAKVVRLSWEGALDDMLCTDE